MFAAEVLPLLIMRGIMAPGIAELAVGSGQAWIEIVKHGDCLESPLERETCLVSDLEIESARQGNRKRVLYQLWTSNADLTPCLEAPIEPHSRLTATRRDLGTIETERCAAPVLH
jgi:hypothetical protein